jgi:hypothetical protein
MNTGAMMYRYLSTLMAAICLLLMAACPKATEKTGNDPFKPENARVKSVEDPYPHWTERPYLDIHEDARQAWYLVEISYLVIKDKYSAAQELKNSADAAERAEGQKLYSEVVTEIDRVVFGTNDSVEALFNSAIEAEPDNPLNYATYAVYLKPRKRFAEGPNFKNTESEALEMLDKAIELWPDEPRFYYMKIYNLTEPHQAHEWSRSAAMEADVIRMRTAEVLDLYAKLEEVDPQNSFVNYSHALFLAKIYTEELGKEPIDEMIRELRKGNAKPNGRFYYPPPLKQFEFDAMRPKLYANQTEAVYVDLWLHYGNLDPYAVNQMVRIIDVSQSWPADKKDIGEAMYALYALGRLEPFDRTFFNLQLKCLHRKQEEMVKTNMEEANKIAETTRFLNEQYLAVSNRLYDDGVVKDQTRLGVLAIEDMENSPLSGNKYMYKYMQGPQAAYLKRAGEILGLDFPLPADTSKW